VVHRLPTSGHSGRAVSSGSIDAAEAATVSHWYATVVLLRDGAPVAAIEETVLVRDAAQAPATTAPTTRNDPPPHPRPPTLFVAQVVRNSAFVSDGTGSLDSTESAPDVSAGGVRARAGAGSALSRSLGVVWSSDGSRGGGDGEVGTEEHDVTDRK